MKRTNITKKFVYRLMNEKGTFKKYLSKTIPRPNRLSRQAIYA